MEYLIGLDIGTSSVKGIAFSTRAESLVEAQVDYALRSPTPGVAEQEPDEIVDAAIEVLRMVVSKMATLPLAVSFSSAMHSLIAIDSDHQPLTKVITWADRRAKAQADGLKGTSLGKDIYRHTGTPIHPMSPLCKIAWLREHERDIFDRTACFVGIKEYLIHRFFGEWVIDLSIASATGLLHLQEADWYPPALQFAGITPDRLPRLVMPGYQLTPLSAEVSKKTGLDPQVPFVIGGSDGCLANLGALAIRPGEAAITIGTSGAVRVAGQSWCYDERERIFNYLLTENLYVLGGATNNGGVVLEWFAEQFFPELSIAELLAEVEGVDAGAEGLLFLPYIYGERAPVWDSEARGIFVGIHSRHRRSHFARAVAEGVIYNIVEVLLALEETTGAINEIYANGGFARSKMLVQMLADISGKPVFLNQTNQASALGAVFLALLSLGKVNRMEDFYELRQAGDPFVPDPVQNRRYQEILARFRQIYPRFSGIK